MTAASARSARRSVSARTLDGRASSASDRSASSLSRELSFSKTLSSADAYADVVPEALSFGKLEEAVTLLTKANRFLQLENEIFQDKLSKESPDLLKGLAVILEEELVAPPPSKRQSGAGVASASSLGQDEPAAHAPAAPAPSPAPPSLSRSDDTRGSQSRSQPSRVRISASASDTLSGSTPRLAALRTRASAASAASRAGRPGPGGSVTRAERAPRMSLGQRVDLAEEAEAQAAHRGRALRAEGEAAAADLRARTEETQAQLAETRAARAGLEADVAASGAGDRATAEKFLRYMNDWLKQTDAAVERLRLKSSSLRAHHRRVRAVIAVKRELGDALRPVDFDKIRIEIEEYNRKIDSKNRHLADLKNISGRATARLLAGKKRLSDLCKQLDAIRKEAGGKRNQIAALEREEAKVLEDVARADTALNAIRVRLERHAAPDVLEYVRLKQDLDLLRRDVVVWERRCKIQQQTALHLRKAKDLHFSASARSARSERGGQGPAGPVGPAGPGHVRGSRLAGQVAEAEAATATDSSSERGRRTAASASASRGPPRRRRRPRRPRRARPQSAHRSSTSSDSDSCTGAASRASRASPGCSSGSQSSRGSPATG